MSDEQGDMDFKTEDHYKDGDNEFGKYGLLEKGVYKFAIMQAQVRPTKKEDGSYLELMLQVIEGKRKGACIFPKYNLSNPSQQAVEIGNRELSKLTQALGMATCKNSQLLIAKEVYGEVYIKKDKTGKNDPENKIRAFKNKDADLEEMKKEVGTTAGSDNDNVPW